MESIVPKDVTEQASRVGSRIAPPSWTWSSLTRGNAPGAKRNCWITVVRRWSLSILWILDIVEAMADVFLTCLSQPASHRATPPCT